MIKDVHELGAVTAVRLSGHVDAENAADVKARLHELIAGGSVRLVLDLGELTFLDSSGLGVLVSCLRRCVAAGGDLCLAGVPDFAREILEITRLTRVFRLCATEAEAARALEELHGQPQ